MHYLPWTFESLLEGDNSRAVAALRDALDGGPGYALLSGFPLDGVGDAVRDELLLRAARLLGEATPHGASGKLIWEITPRATVGTTPTFSETADEAPLHTDNGWVPVPEKYLTMLAVNPADEGGDTIVLPVATAVEGFSRLPRAAEALALLREEAFPFAVPTVFREPGRPGSGPDTLVAAVFGSEVPFRYRYDIIRAGFALRPDLASPRRLWALECFDAYLRLARERAPRVRLRRGDLLFVNNHAVLHARTAFDDGSRLLLRVRMSAARAAVHAAA